MRKFVTFPIALSTWILCLAIVWVVMTSFSLNCGFSFKMEEYSIEALFSLSLLQYQSLCPPWYYHRFQLLTLLFCLTVTQEIHFLWQFTYPTLILYIAVTQTQNLPFDQHLQGISKCLLIYSLSNFGIEYYNWRWALNFQLGAVYDNDVIGMFLVQFSENVIQYINPPMGPHFEGTKADVQKVEPRYKYIRNCCFWNSQSNG